MRKAFFVFLSLLSGILLSFPWMVQGSGWTLFIAFFPLFFAETFLTDQFKFRNSFFLAYPAFFTWNLLSTWWIAYVSVAGMLFIVAANALLMSLIWGAANKVKRIFGLLPGYFTLLVFWLSFEFISHRGALPWPWLTLGNGFANSVYLIQWYEFTGVLGGSFWVLLVNIIFFEAIKTIKITGYRKFVGHFILLFAILILPILFSRYLYSDYSDTGEVRRVVVLQPNVDPYTEKFNGMSEKDQIQRLVNLAEQSVTDSTNLILAPETAFPAMWEDSARNEVLNNIRKVIRTCPKANFIAGAITKRKNDLTDVESRQNELKYDRFNSAFLVNDRQNLQFSHKTILVAGVEKAPFREYFNFLPEYLIDPGGSTGELTPGKSPALLKMNTGELAGPVICFESAFGNFVSQQVLNGAAYLVVLTNDGWWKHSAGVWQHFSYAKIRAIETRRSVVRSANTGISGCINQCGEILCQSKVAETGALSCAITTNSRLTFYVVYGDYLGKGSLWLSFAIVLYVAAYRRKVKA